ncbi:CRISPR-associated endoribonuclease Cas6 [Clostridium perfringens]|uniref:CRISPR-associated endoribonuclease Cas6 n=1 Tax=Clostridium perfringens TaxID=1502 RepID=UPI0039EC3861
MRVKIDLKINDNFEFKDDVNEGITAFIYRALDIVDPKFSKKVHDEGFKRLGKQAYAFHSYALLQSNKVVKNKLEKGIATLILTSSVDKIVMDFTKGILKIGGLQIYGKTFNILNIHSEDKKVGEGLFFARSPICMFNVNRKWVEKSKLAEALKINIIKKYTAFYDTLPREFNFEVTLLDTKAEYIKYKYGIHKGYVGLVAIKGDKDLIQLAYDAGIGSHTGIGLGLLEAI